MWFYKAKLANGFYKFLFIFIMEYIKYFYELYDPSAPDIFESGANPEYHQSLRRAFHDPASRFHSIKKFSGSV
jgi:hypothetical protein